MQGLSVVNGLGDAMENIQNLQVPKCRPYWMTELKIERGWISKICILCFSCCLIRLFQDCMEQSPAKTKKKEQLVVLLARTKSWDFHNSQIGRTAVKKIYACLRIPTWQLICKNSKVILLYSALERLLYCSVRLWALHLDLRAFQGAGRRKS